MKPDFSAADHRARGQRQQNGGLMFDKALETIPDRGWSLAQLAQGIEGQIEQDQWQISIAQQQIGSFERFGGFLAADPEQARKIDIQSGGIEAIASIDQPNPLRMRAA